jgi:hypothetical protein
VADPPDPTKVTVGPTRFRYLGAAFAIGAVVGYAIVPVIEHLNATAPMIQWDAVVVLVAIAAMQFAKACALMGALVAGGYLGFGVQFVDQMDIALPRERVIRSFAAAAAGAVVVVCGLLLERACRIPRDPDE